MRTILFVFFAYLSGSVLYADLFGSLAGKKQLLQDSADKNPGAANAFRYYGLWYGLLTLAGDLAKGFLPVRLYIRSTAPEAWAIPLIMAAPVLGHILPLFHRFHGGKGIAATFGVLLGLCPYAAPVVLFASVFVLLSTVLRVDPTFYRTMLAYVLTAAAMLAVRIAPEVQIGFFVICCAVLLRLHRSDEEREKPEVKLLWMH